MKTYIFDIDGTIANTEHRQHFIRHRPYDWDSWFAVAHKDVPYWEIVDLMELSHNAGIKNVLCTGRDEAQRQDTLDWLEQHNIVWFDKLYMRPYLDRRDDDIVKFELYEQMLADGYEPVLVFEDRNRVVKMWRSMGIKCLQVEPGDF